MLQLTSARDTVNSELEKLDHTGEECIQTLNKAFQEIHAAVDQRKNELIAKVQETKECKKAILNEQLSLITDEKDKVSPCVSVKYNKVDTLKRRRCFLYIAGREDMRWTRIPDGHSRY